MSDLAKRLRSQEAIPNRNEVADYIDALEAENADLKSTAIAYVAIAAVEAARDWGLPKGHLLPHHYDLLAKHGARMVAFTRANLEAAQ